MEFFETNFDIFYLTKKGVLAQEHNIGLTHESGIIFD
jgi:hypothetical protein